MTIYFDMDGTIADLYSVPNWPPMLRAENANPYILAGQLGNLDKITELCAELQKHGVRIGIVSWCSKNGSCEYNRMVRAAKKEWLRKNFPIKFNEIHIVKYGTPKHLVVSDIGYLIDDEARNREKWSKKFVNMIFDPTAEPIENFLNKILIQCQ